MRKKRIKMTSHEDLAPWKDAKRIEETQKKIVVKIRLPLAQPLTLHFSLAR